MVILSGRNVNYKQTTISLNVLLLKKKTHLFQFMCVRQ